MMAVGGMAVAGGLVGGLAGAAIYENQDAIGQWGQGAIQDAQNFDMGGAMQDAGEWGGDAMESAGEWGGN